MNFKIGTYINKTSGSRDPIFGEILGQRSRSQGHIMYVAKYALPQYRVVLLTSYLGADITTTPQQVGHKTVAMATLVA